MIKLYPHQLEYVNKLRSALRSNRSVLAQAATGFGKTAVASYATHSAAEKGKRVIFTVHRKELITQTAKTFDKFGIDYGIIASGYSEDPYQNVQIASIDTLKRRLHKNYPCDLLIPDEAHLSMSDGWSKVINHYMGRGSRILGLSGSPSRLDGRGLGDLFDVMVCGPSVKWLIDNKYLSDYRLFAPSSPDLSGVHARMGDYINSESCELMDTPSITGDAIEHYLKHSKCKRALCFCVNVKHSQHTAQQFCAAGIPAAHIDGTTPPSARKQIISDLANGKIWVLCNVEIVTTGFDLSSQIDRDVPVETVILLRPTMSLALYLQMIGRGLRYKPQKAIILDHANNWKIHGYPDDERDWSLEGSAINRRTKNDDTEQVDIKQCPQCFAVHKPADICPECGHVYIIKQRIIDHRDGDLVEIDRDKLRLEQRKKQSNAQTLTDLMATGMSEGQAKHIIAARAEKALLRRTLANLYTVKGVSFSAFDIARLKPKELKLEIDRMKM